MSAAATRAAPGTRRRRMVGPALSVAALAVAGTALRLRDPHVEGSWGVCPSAALGLTCPGCGGLRAVHDLTGLDLAGAASSNLALVVATPVLLLALVAWGVARWRARPWPRPPDAVLLGAALVLGALLVAFTVARNLPGSWLAP